MTLKLVGFQIDQDSSAKAAFAEFDKLCQIRHAAVHARGDLSLKNLRDLGMEATRGRLLAIHLELSSLHAAASICQNVVRAYNRLAFGNTVELWIGQRLLSGTWEKDGERFTSLFALFHSRNDRRGYSNAYHAHRALVPIVAKALAGPPAGS